MSGAVDLGSVRDWLRGFQSQLTSALEAADGLARFAPDVWSRPEGGGGESRVLVNGGLIEKGGVNFSHVSGDTLPPAATASRPALAGRPWEALGVSWVLHPDNPRVPITHGNLRFFYAPGEGEPPIWWFGGGFDLTPVYPFFEDAVHWHRHAKAACDPFGVDVYPRFKGWCDSYFHLPHRDETRGVGGLFFDDLDEWGFARCFQFTRSVGDAVLPAWLPIAERRRTSPWGEREKAFQLYRRGRYVEFNLLFDRGTKFGIQSRGRTESILMSLPPEVRWEYGWEPEPGSEEAALADFLRPRDWLAEADR